MSFFFVIFFFLLTLKQSKWKDYYGYVRISWYEPFMMVAQNMENGMNLYVYFRYTCIAIYYNNYNFENNHLFFLSSLNILMKKKYDYGVFIPTLNCYCCWFGSCTYFPAFAILCSSRLRDVIYVSNILCRKGTNSIQFNLNHYHAQNNKLTKVHYMTEQFSWTIYFSQFFSAWLFISQKRIHKVKVD